MNVGIIGLGHGSRVMIEALKLSNFKIHGISSKTYCKAKQIQKSKNINRVYKNWIDLVKDEKIELVAIAVPPKIQPKIIEECIKYKKKIFAEKPVSADFNNSNKILNKLKDYNDHFIIDYIYPEHKLFKKFIEKVITQNKNRKNIELKLKFTNQSYVIKNNINNWKTKINSGGGIINLYLIHIIDYLILFIGSIENIKRLDNKRNNNQIKLSINFNNQSNVKVYINGNNKTQIHSIIYKNSSSEILLINNGRDYVKNFKIIEKSIKNNLIKKYYDDDLKSTNIDARIKLTQLIVRKFNKKFNEKNHIKLINRYLNVEKWINEIKKL